MPTYPLFESEDLAAYPGGPSSLAPAQFDLTLTLVIDALESVLGSADGWTADETARARLVGMGVAARAWRNPQGLTSWTVDDVTQRREGAAAQELGFFVTDSEAARLRGDPVVPAAFTIRPGRAAL